MTSIITVRVESGSAICGAGETVIFSSIYPIPFLFFTTEFAEISNNVTPAFNIAIPAKAGIHIPFFLFFLCALGVLRG